MNYKLNPKIWKTLITGKNMQPWLHLQNICELQITVLKEHQIKGLIFDVDNTLTLHGAPAIHPKIAATFAKLSGTFNSVIFSNCGKNRNLELQNIFELPVVESTYKKPSLDGFTRALSLLNLPPENVAMIGDRTLTDIYGANQAGIKSILVDPFSNQEPRAIRIIRYIERQKLFK